ncbi:MAG: ArsC family reductase [Mariprofundaceae bacterium]
MTVDMYGIANCDTIKKARAWLGEHGVDVVFHDYKKIAANADLLQGWCTQAGWEVLLNKRGTTWRKLDVSDKEGLDEAKAIALLVANSSMIKRPVLIKDGVVTVGFSVERYQALFS